MSPWRDTITCGLSGLAWHVKNTEVRRDWIRLSYDRETRRLAADIKALGQWHCGRLGTVRGNKSSYRSKMIPRSACSVYVHELWSPGRRRSWVTAVCPRLFPLKHLPMHCIIYGKRFADCKVCRTHGRSIFPLYPLQVQRGFTLFSLKFSS